MKTVGISPKTVLAFLYPFIATVVGVLVAWIATGSFDVQELRLAAAGLVTSGLAALGAFVGKPGIVVPKGVADENRAVQ